MFITISSLILVASSTNSSLDNSEGFIGLPNTTLTLQGLNLLSSSNPLLAPSIVTGTINALALVAKIIQVFKIVFVFAINLKGFLKRNDPLQLTVDSFQNGKGKR